MIGTVEKTSETIQLTTQKEVYTAETMPVPQPTKAQLKMRARMMETGLIHKDKSGHGIAKIYRLKHIEKSRYSGDVLREIRMKQTREALKANGYDGVTNVSKIA